MTGFPRFVYRRYASGYPISGVAILRHAQPVVDLSVRSPRHLNIQLADSHFDIESGH